MSSSIADFKKRRSWLRISENILKVCKQGCRTTQIVYATNIAFPRFKKYSEFMIEKGLLEERHFGSDKFFLTTDKGNHFLELMDKISTLLE